MRTRWFGLVILGFGAVLVGSARAEDDTDLRARLAGANVPDRAKILRRILADVRTAGSVLFEIGTDKSIPKSIRSHAITSSGPFLDEKTIATCLERIDQVIPTVVVSDEDQLKMWPYRFALRKRGWPVVPHLLKWAESSTLRPSQVRHGARVLANICGRRDARALVRSWLATRQDSEGLAAILTRLTRDD